MNTDKQDVLELLNRYLLIVDSKDEAAWVDLFTADGEFDNTPDLVKGKPGLAAFIKGWHASEPEQATPPTSPKPGKASLQA